MQRRVIGLLFTVLFVLGTAQSVFAIYQWVDEKGVLHFTDYPPPGKALSEAEAEPKKEEPVKTGPAVKTSPAAVQPVPKSPAPVAASQPVAKPAATAPAAAGKPATTTTSTVHLAPTPTAPGKTAPGPAAQPAPQQVPAPQAPASAPPGIPLPKQMPSKGAAVAFAAGFMLIFLGIVVAVYVYFSFCLYRIAQKTGFENAWAAWIPVIQVWPFLGSAGKPLWWLLLLFIPFVNIVISVYLWMCISENLGKSKWLGLLSVVPIANLVLPGYLAFSNNE